MSTYTPDYELRRRIIGILRGDAGLSNTSTGLLFPSHAPQLSADDIRVFESGPDITDGSDAISTFPRVTIETMCWAHAKEQEDPAVLHGPCRVWVRTTVEQQDEQLGERIDAYITAKLLSTQLTDSRILAGNLALDGQRRAERLSELNGARDIVTGFYTASVGSLA